MSNTPMPEVPASEVPMIPADQIAPFQCEASDIHLVNNYPEPLRLSWKSQNLADVDAKIYYMRKETKFLILTDYDRYRDTRAIADPVLQAAVGRGEATCPHCLSVPGDPRMLLVAVVGKDTGLRTAP